MENIEITEPDSIQIDSLYPYQKKAIKRQIRNFEILNIAASSYDTHICPKCGASVNHFKKGGYTYRVKNGEKVRDKELVKCPVCGHRFTPDHGQLTYYSHFDSDVWAKVIEDTVEGSSIARTAADLDLSTVTVFNMRHKFLHFLEASNEQTIVTKPSEADENYVQECHKGLINARIESDTIIINKDKERP